MRLLNRHHFENVDNATGQNIEKRSIGMSDMHPGMTVLQQSPHPGQYTDLQA